MTEFIGARISLISKSEIRYTGTLHEINSENSTVALEQVVSHGTEGRRKDPAQEMPGSDNVYEYIVFRGSDVKDLHIEEQPAKKPPPPQVLNDPAILGSSQRPGGPYGPYQQPPPMSPYYPQYPQPPQQQQRFGPSPGPYPGSHMPPGGMAHPPMHQGSHQGHPQDPPPMYPGPQSMGGAPGFPQPPQSQQMPPMPQTPVDPPQQPQGQTQQQQQPTGPQANRGPPRAPAGPAASRQQAPVRQPHGPGAMQQQQSRVNEPAPTVPVETKPPAPSTTQPQKPTTPPTEAAAASVTSAAPQNAQNATMATPTKPPTGPKARGGIVPALPLTSPGRPLATPARTNGSSAVATNANTSTRPSAPGTTSEGTSAVQDLANKVNQLALKASNSTQAAPSAPAVSAVPAQNNESYPTAPRSRPGTGGFVARGTSRNYRGGNYGGNQQARKVEVPTTDYDFETANAKFNKKDMVKEAIATGDVPSAVPANGDATNGDAGEKVVIPPPAAIQDGSFYNRGKSFFDNISCENKERSEAKPGEKRGGAAFRSEEQKKNLETFGQGSVDGGYGGYHRGRGWRGGRGRGYGGRRGYAYGGGRGGGFRPPQVASAQQQAQGLGN